MTIAVQDDFSGGIFRGLKAPRGYVYDAVDGLIDDERLLFRRGGVTYKSAAAGDAFKGLVDAWPYAGQRTLGWTPTEAYMLAVDDTSLTAIPSGHVLRPFARPVGVGGYIAVPYANHLNVMLWAGSRKTSRATEQVSWTAGSKTLTGTATTWLTTVDRGMVISSLAGFETLVDSVQSDTSLTMRDAPPGSGALVVIQINVRRLLASAAVLGLTPPTPPVLAAVGTPARLVLCSGNRAAFSKSGTPTSFSIGDYHELPPSAVIVAADSLRDNLVLFSTEGVWIASNMNFDLTDKAGNPQQQLAQVSKDVLAWNESGIVGWAGRLVVPALDDVYLFGVDGSAVPVSRGIRPLYRGYVKAGYRPGLAAVHRGHYFLPIIDSSGTAIDELVCRLDQLDSRGSMRPGWTRFGGQAMATANAVRVPAAAGTSPRLFGTSGTRIIDMTDCFAPAGAVKRDADGTTHALDVTLNDIETGPGNRNTVIKVRVKYDLVDSASDDPTLSASYYADAPEGASSVALSGSAAETDGSLPKTWKVGKRCRRFRLRLLSSGPAATLRLRSVEHFVRPSNRP